MREKDPLYPFKESDGIEVIDLDNVKVPEDEVEEESFEDDGC